MKKERNTVQKFCLWAGIGLLAVSVVMLAWWRYSVSAAEQQKFAYVQTIRTLIPEPRGAVPEVRADNRMAVLSVDGVDFVGILELPRYGEALPVCAQWGAVSKYPCRFDGSIYDRTMQIGTTSQTGQLDFYREISVGDEVYFTDMEGNRYGYSVTDVRYEKTADQAALQRKEAALTLFVKNVYGLEYIVIFCDVLS